MLAAMLPPGGRGPHGSSRSGLATLWNHSNPGHSTLSRMGSKPYASSAETSAYAANGRSQGIGLFHQKRALDMAILTPELATALNEISETQMRKVSMEMASQRSKLNGLAAGFDEGCSCDGAERVSNPTDRSECNACLWPPTGL